MFRRLSCPSSVILHIPNRHTTSVMASIRLLTIAAVLVLSAAFTSATAHQHAAFHNNRHIGRHLHAAAAGLRPDAPELQSRQIDVQDLATTRLTGLQTFSTTYTYSYWTFSACSDAATTKIDSSQITTSTVLTILASDQFHAFQSLLTAGQSVQDEAKRSASRARRALQTPVSVAPSTALVSAKVTSSTASESIPISAPTSFMPSSSTASTSSSQAGGALASACVRPENGIALAIAIALLNA